VTAEAEPGRLLGGRYRIDALLGRGGMSEVHHGYDERLDRPVAIKVLRQPTRDITGDGPEALELLDVQRRDRARFLREIRTAARLEHPGTPAIYDTGIDEHPDGSSRIWLVMQLLRGSTLEGLLDRADYDTAPPEVSWAAATGAQIAAVLTDLHRVDIVHRDIKPANVMIVDGGLVKVLDFGIAILRGAGALPRLTQVDRTVGTPTYMSPEQHLGRAVTAASDVYSLGCLLYELLTGDPPFLPTPNTPLRAHHLQSPVPSARSVRPGVPEALDALVSAMLAKDPDARPSAEQVYSTLVPLIDNSRPPVSDENRDPTRPFRTPLLAPPAPRELASGGTPLTEQEFEQIKADVAALLKNGDNTEAVRLLEAGLGRSSANRFFGLELRRLLGLALFYIGEYRRAAGLLTDAGNQYRLRLPSSHPRVVECAYHAGHAYAEIGDPTRALAHLRFYLQNVDVHDPKNSEFVLESRFVIAQMLATEERTAEALAELEEIRPAFQATYGGDSIHVRNLQRQIDRLRLA
jgi:serine/threonine protein kinase